MVNKKSRNKTRLVRHLRIRKTIFGTATSPRLNVFRSNTNIYAQIINDEQHATLVSASTLEKDLAVKNKANIASAKVIGEVIAKRALENGITNVVFDRGGYLYHGRIKALAEAAREAGLKF